MNVEQEYAQEFDYYVAKYKQLLEDPYQGLNRRQKIKAFIRGVATVLSISPRHTYEPPKRIGLESFFDGLTSQERFLIEQGLDWKNLDSRLAGIATGEINDRLFSPAGAVSGREVTSAGYENARRAYVNLRMNP